MYSKVGFCAESIPQLVSGGLAFSASVSQQTHLHQTFSSPLRKVCLISSGRTKINSFGNKRAKNTNSLTRCAGHISYEKGKFGEYGYQTKEKKNMVTLTEQFPLPIRL